MNTVKALYHKITATLVPKVGAGEAKEMALIIFENLKGWNMTDILVKGDNVVSDFIVEKAENVLKRIVEDDEPIQYIFGTAHFYGMVFDVTRDTLIPRQETAQLVDIIVEENGDEKDLNVLDIGTGSGCIAVSLARNLKFSHVTGIDISAGAIEVARKNAAKLRANVDFVCEDFFAYPDANEKFDIIVSNPPYIAMSEAKTMERNVLDYEPHTALFVPDSNPLEYYTAIADYGIKNSKTGGRLYFEINPLFAEELKVTVEKAGWGNVTLIRDMFGKIRFLKAIRP